jgi:hypothetical protein
MGEMKMKMEKSKKVLNVVECAYRATLEEQEDTALWFAHMGAAKAGVDTTLLLRGNAVNYLNKRQRVEALRIGDRHLGHPPKLVEDVEAFIKAGIPVYYVEEDAGERGLERSDFVAGGKPLARLGVASFIASFDRVLHG